MGLLIGLNIEARQSFFRRPFAFLCCTGRLKTSLKTSDKRNQAQNNTRGVCQYDGVVAFFFQKAVGKP